MSDSTEIEKPPIKPDPTTELDTVVNDSGEVQGPRLWLINASLCLCTFIAGLDFTLIATAIPYITSEFNSIQDVGWYGASFQLAICATQPLAGKTFILFPKKVIYLIYLAIFEIGSLVCALAPNSNALIVGRAVAGLGASGMFAGGFAVQAAIIPMHKRAIWIGARSFAVDSDRAESVSTNFAIASIVGPVIGGALTQDVTWRWCFYLNLPIGGFAAAMFFLSVHIKPAITERRPLLEKLRGLDGVGFALFAGSITMLLLALQWGGNDFGWNSSVIIGLFVGFGVTMILFVAWQLHMQDDALIPPMLFKAHRNVALICASAFFLNGPFQVIIYWLPIWFQAVLQVSPSRSGVNFLPTVISDAVTALLGTGIVMQIGWWNPFLLFANAMVSLGGGLLSTISPEISSGHWIGYQIFGGVGYSLASNLAHVGMQASLPSELAPTGSSNLLGIISTSCSIFLAVGQLTFQRRLEINLSAVVSPSVATDVISTGATNFRSVLPASVDASAVVHAYGKSVTQAFYITAAAPVISFFLACGCQWISTKASKTTTTTTEPESLEDHKNQ